MCIVVVRRQGELTNDLNWREGAWWVPAAPLRAAAAAGRLRPAVAP
eukprot:gene15144-15525_t